MLKRRTVVVRLPAWLPEPSRVAERRVQAQMQRMPAILTPRSGTQTKREQQQQIRIELDQRWAILGRTNTGKTTFARELVNELRRFRPWAALYILDSKGTGDFRQFPGHIEQADPPAADTLTEGVQVWRPPTLRVDRAQTDAWLDSVLNRRRPAIVLIDELSATTRGNKPTDYPASLEVMQKTGRALNICLICLTQEVFGAPRQVLSQMSHCIRFGLGGPREARVADQLIGLDPSREPSAAHGFFWADVQSYPRKAFEYTDFREFFGRS